jgi:universal stress protein A
MGNYKHILLAVDFFDQDEVISSRAKDLADKYQAKLSLVHVVDSLPATEIGGYWIDIPSNLDLTDEIMAAAKKRLTKLAERLNVPQDRMWLEMGSPKLEIVRVAKENNIDLIIVGSHGRHGLALLLGSTANGVLHHAVCDVLAVRLRDE